MTAERFPQPRYIVLVPMSARRDDVEYDYHHNHRLYETGGVARGYAKKENLAVGPIDEEIGEYQSVPARVFIVDPILLEEYGLTPQAEYEFCDRMAIHWAQRLIEADKKVRFEDSAAPRPKRERAKPEPRRRRQQQRVSQLARQALTVGAAAALGQMIGNALSPRPPGPAPDGNGGSGTVSLFPFTPKPKEEP